MGQHPGIKKSNRFALYKMGWVNITGMVGQHETERWVNMLRNIHETRVLQLKQLLSDCKYELIFISTFLTKQDYIENIPDVAWESEVWMADNPEHMIHFNGDKFLGPYKKNS